MDVLIVGGGGREHALAWAIAKSPRAGRIVCAPGNGGIAAIAECVAIAATDIAAMVDYAVKERFDLVVVAPDDPLALGMVDAMEAAGLRAFGPRKDAAIIEASKMFAKDLMKHYDIPTADYAAFDDAVKALAYVDNCKIPVVVKADGLALGKGVFICHTRADARDAVRAIMQENRFGAAGQRVVLEAYLEGPEVSVLAFTDGKTFVPLPSAQDHKRIFDGNRGPNTGGMGAFSPSPNFTPEIAEIVERTIMLPTIRAMEAEGRRFQGVLYFGLMLTREGPKVLEYNARFGDPETQAVLMLMESDILDAFDAVIDGKLDQADIRFSDGAAACIVMASGGYPGAYETDKPIAGLDQAQSAGATVFHAGTKQKDGAIVTAGGRVLGVSATADTMEQALATAYDACACIHFDEAYYRKDIGKV